jgi:hypothetical protein
MPAIVVVPPPVDPNAPPQAMPRTPAPAAPVAPPPVAAPTGTGEASPTAPWATKGTGMANFKWVYEGNNKPHPDTGSSDWLVFIEAMVQDDADPLIHQIPARIDNGSQVVYSFLRVPNVMMWQYDGPGWKTYIYFNKTDGSVIGVTVVVVVPEAIPTFKSAGGSIQRTQLSSGVTFGSLDSSVVDHFRYGWPASGYMMHTSFLVLNYPDKNVTMTFGTQSGSRLRRITSITVGRAYHLTQYPTDEVKLKPKVVDIEPGTMNGGSPTGVNNGMPAGAPGTAPSRDPRFAPGTATPISPELPENGGPTAGPANQGGLPPLAPRGR